MEWLVAAGLCLLFFTIFGNIFHYHYGRMIVDMAVEDGVQAGMAVPEDQRAARCEARAHETLREMLGYWADDVHVQCRQVPYSGYFSVRADMKFDLWLLPDSARTLDYHTYRISTEEV